MNHLGVDPTVDNLIEKTKTIATAIERIKNYYEIKFESHLLQAHISITQTTMNFITQHILSPITTEPLKFKRARHIYQELMLCEWLRVCGGYLEQLESYPIFYISYEGQIDVLCYNSNDGGTQEFILKNIDKIRRCLITFSREVISLIVANIKEVEAVLTLYNSLNNSFESAYSLFNNEEYDCEKEFHIDLKLLQKVSKYFLNEDVKASTLKEGLASIAAKNLLGIISSHNEDHAASKSGGDEALIYSKIQYAAIECIKKISPLETISKCEGSVKKLGDKLIEIFSDNQELFVIQASLQAPANHEITLTTLKDLASASYFKSNDELLARLVELIDGSNKKTSIIPFFSSKVNPKDLTKIILLTYKLAKHDMIIREYIEHINKIQGTYRSNRPALFQQLIEAVKSAKKTVLPKTELEVKIYKTLISNTSAASMLSSVLVDTEQNKTIAATI